MRTLFSLWIFTTILFSAIPEHKKMIEEFGIEANSAFSLMLTVGDWFAKLFPLFLLVLFLVFFYLIFFHRSLAMNYFRRWLPGRWRQTVLPEPILTRKLLAWDLLAFRGGQQENQHVDWDALVKHAAVAMPEAEIAKKVASRETQAWLLRNMADQKYNRKRDRASLIIDIASLLIQLAIAFLIVLIAFAMITMLLDVMNGLGGIK